MPDYVTAGIMLKEQRLGAYEWPVSVLLAAKTFVAVDVGVQLLLVCLAGNHGTSCHTAAAACFHVMCLCWLEHSMQGLPSLQQRLPPLASLTAASGSQNRSSSRLQLGACALIVSLTLPA